MPMITLCPTTETVPVEIETEVIKRGGGKPRLETFTALSRKNYVIHDGSEPKTFNMSASTEDKSLVDTLFEWYTNALLCVLSIEDIEGSPETYTVVIEEYSYDDDGEMFNYSISLEECEDIIEVSQ